MRIKESSSFTLKSISCYIYNLKQAKRRGENFLTSQFIWTYWKIFFALLEQIVENLFIPLLEWDFCWTCLITVTCNRSNETIFFNKNKTNTCLDFSFYNVIQYNLSFLDLAPSNKSSDIIFFPHTCLHRLVTFRNLKSSPDHPSFLSKRVSTSYHDYLSLQCVED